MEEMNNCGSCDKLTFMIKRDLERKLDVEKRKNEKSQLTSDTEKIGYFEETFINKRSQIEELINNSNDISNKNELAEHFNNISKEILILQKYVAASNIFLRSYDIKKCHESLQILTNRAKELEDELLPKKRFGFKAKINKKVETKSIKTKDEVDFCKPNAHYQFEDNISGFSNKQNEILILKNEEIFMKDVSIENLENCQVKLFGSPSTLHLSHLSNCTILSGPVSTSIFAENCQNCTLIIACQQLRLHSSKNVNIYLHVTSRAIMEDCCNILLAPYNWRYEGIEKDFIKAGLDIKTNNWTCIDDFNWLNIEKHSPNWNTIPEEELKKSWNGE